MAYVISPPVTTRADFAKAVLQEIGITASGDDPSAEDQSDVLKRWDRAWAYLNKLEKISSPADVFPAEIVQPLIEYVGVLCKPLFGLQVAIGEEDTALQALVAVSGRTYSTRTAYNIYF